VLADGLLDELLGQFGAFPGRDHPAGDVAAEDVEDDVEIEVGPLGRARSLVMSQLHSWLGAVANNSGLW